MKSTTVWNHTLAQRNLPHVLYATIELPFPPLSGGAVRDHAIISALHDHFNIHLAVVGQDAVRDDLSLAQSYCASVALGESCHASAIPGSSVRAFHNNDVNRHLHEVTDFYNPLLAHVEGVYSMPILSGINLPTILEIQNIEWQIDAMLGRNGLQMRSDIQMGRTYERACWQAADELIALSSEDFTIAVAETAATVNLIPNGWDHLALTTARDTRANSHPIALFIGNFDYPPNISAANALADHIFPDVSKEVPGLQLLIAGHGSVRRFPELVGRSGINVVDDLDSVESALSSATVMVAPLLAGGGVKVKVLEALSYGLPIVGSPIAAQGLEIAVSEGAILVGNNLAEIKELLTALLQCPRMLTSAQQACHRATSQMLRWTHQMVKVEEAWDRVIKRGAGSSRLSRPWKCNCGWEFAL